MNKNNIFVKFKFSYDEILSDLADFSIDDIVFTLQEDTEIKIDNVSYLISDKTDASVHTDWLTTFLEVNSRKHLIYCEAQLEYVWYDTGEADHAIDLKIDNQEQMIEILTRRAAIDCIALCTNKEEIKNLAIEQVMISNNRNVFKYPSDKVKKIIIEA